MNLETDEISTALHDELVSWRRVVNGAAPDKARDVFDMAASALWSACAIDKTIHPDAADLSFQAVVDTLTEIGTGIGLDIDDVQHIITNNKDTKPYTNGKVIPTETKPAPLSWLDVRGWDGTAAPARQWAILNRSPLKQAGLFSGEGGTGKSIIELTKNVAHVTGKEWLGSMPQEGAAFYIGAEDDADELHRRLELIVAHYDVSFKELAKRGFHIMSMIGKDATLVSVSRGGKVETTALYKQLYEAAGDIKPKNISIDTLSHAFAGNEIDRIQVYAFAIHMQALAIVANGSVTILSHPSLAGMATGTGLSGSTAWHSAFRFRHYLKGAKKDDESSGDEREIEFKKNQYGPLGETIRVRYQNGLFLPESGEKRRTATPSEADALFLDLLYRFRQANRQVSDRSGKTYAPAQFAKEEEAQRLNLDNRKLEQAMLRLFKAGKIANEEHGPPSHRRTHIAPVEKLL